MSDPLNAALLEKAKREKARRATANSQPQAIATTQDGGAVYKAQDGSLSFASPGYSTSDPDVISRIMQGATPADISKSGFDQSTVAQNPIAARAQEFVNGIPLIGEFADEAVGVVSPSARDAMRSTSDAMEREYPKSSAALNIAGGVAGSIPAIGPAVNLAKGGASTLGILGRAAVTGAGAGAVDGAASGAGRGETKSERQEGAVKGAVLGGALGGTLGGLAPLAGKGLKALTSKARNLDVRVIMDEFGLSPKAARSVKAALKNDDMQTAISRLSQLGDDAMLADAGPSTGALLDASSKTGGRALAVTRDAVESRSKLVGKRLPGTLDRILGKPSGVKTAAKEIASETSPIRKRLYDRAYAQPIDYADKGRAVESVLSRVPPKTLNSAIAEANEAMLEGGLTNQQIMASIADDGDVVFKEMPNVRQLDEIKQALDGIAREAVDQFGRPTKQGLRASRLARDLRDSVKEAVPAYSQALKVAGDKIERDEALSLGSKLLWKATKLEDVQQFMARGVSADSKTALRQGMRSSIEDTLSNVKRTITDPNVDAREAMGIVKEMSSRANISKVRMVLGQKQADALLSELDKTATALELRSVVARNSDTAIRQAVQGQVVSEASPGVARRIAGEMGNPFDGVKEITRALTGTDAATLSEGQQEIFAEIANSLVSIRGADAKRALVTVNRALNGQPIKTAEADRLAEYIGGPAFLAAYQSGMQSLESRPR